MCPSFPTKRDKKPTALTSAMDISKEKPFQASTISKSFPKNSKKETFPNKKPDPSIQNIAYLHSLHQHIPNIYTKIYLYKFPMLNHFISSSLSPFMLAELLSLNR